MKKLLNLLMLITVISITSCTKEETVQPQARQAIDFRAELIKSDWIYVSSEEWKFIDDNKIQATILNSSKITTHTYNIINDSFVVVRNYSGIYSTVSYPNLKLSNDTLYWRSYNSINYNAVLIRKK